MKNRIHCAWVILAAALFIASEARADFGPLGPDARILGKGGAAVADAEGPGALYWNPAGLRRTPGISASFSLGLLQRPDFGEGKFGSTNRLYLAAVFAPKSEGLLGALGAGLAIETPFPRFDYSGQRRIVSGLTSTPKLVAVDASQDYMEILAGVGGRFLRTSFAGRKASLLLGLSFGLGFSSQSADGQLTSLAGPSLTETKSGSGQQLHLPVGFGAMFILDGDRVDISFGIRYRGVPPLSDKTFLEFPQGKVQLGTGDLFMPPPQEGSIGVSAVFLERLTYSLEFTYLFFDGPDAFADTVPHNYPVLKLGFEYRVPFAQEKKELTMRFGYSRAMVDSDNDETVYTASASGLYFGWGLKIDPLADIDFYFSLQMPGDGVVESNSFLASVSYSVRF